MNGRFLAWALTQKWMLHRPVAEHAREVLIRHAQGEKLDAEIIAGIVSERDARFSVIADERNNVSASYPRGMSRDPKIESGYTVAGKVGIVPVDGIICKYADKINGMSQPAGMTPMDIRSAVLASAADTRTRCTVLDIDSPGGTVAGGDDVVEAIRDAMTMTTPQGDPKPVIAYGHDLCCSGAMLLASQCDEFYLGAGTTAGSIGVCALVKDTSDEDQKVHLVASGPFKGMGMPGVPVTDVHLEKMQQEINDQAEWLIQCIASGRELPTKAVKAMATGETWIGKAVVDLGLADGVMGFGELVAELNDKF